MELFFKVRSKLVFCQVLGFIRTEVKSGKFLIFRVNEGLVFFAWEVWESRAFCMHG